MAKARAILKRIHAIKNIAKITNTMEKIATARFKKAFDRAVAARPYTDRLTRLIEELTQAAGDYTHPLLESREETKRVAVLVVASNRGLCGGYNSNIARELTRIRKEFDAREVETELHVVGKKLIGWLRFQKIAMDSQVTHIDDRPAFADVDEIASPFMDRFASGDLDEIHVVYTKFISAGRQQAVTEQVLPLARHEAGEDGEEKGSDYGPETIFSPDPETILSELLPRSVRLHVFQAFLDAGVSEQTARRVAMKAATDSAIEIVGDLTRTYNRSRQAQITTELAEIMGGAAALE